MKSILENISPLKKVSIRKDAEDLIETDNIRKTLQSSSFWGRIKSLCGLLAPIEQAIAMCEGDGVELSIACKIFYELEAKISSVGDDLRNCETLKEDILSAVATRKAFVLKEIHYAANLLDPRYKGCHLTDSERVSIVFTARNSNIRSLAQLLSISCVPKKN